jgi:hypothetical protein
MSTLFERPDWTLFRSLPTLAQKAGVPVGKLSRLVVKELVDNALDVAGTCNVEILGSGRFFVEDKGDGIPGSDAEIAALFSIGRPLASSKLLRLPTRGALGNGLRVVSGAVLGSRGSLSVATRGRILRLIPQDDGTTKAEAIGKYRGRGTRIEVQLGPPLAVDTLALKWAAWAILLAAGDTKYKGKTSPHWYDPDAFFELLQAAGRRTVRKLIAEFDGCTEPKAGEIARPFKARLASDLDRTEATRLLAIAREQAREVKPNRLGCVGMVPGLPAGYAKVEGTMNIHIAPDGTITDVPMVVEAWVELNRCAAVQMFVNRTPITAEIDAWHHKDALVISGCGLENEFRVGRIPVKVLINVETPYMPITSDGKAPDLSPIVDDIASLVSRIVKRAKRATADPEGAVAQKDVILRHLDEAVAKVSGNGQYRFAVRQLFYAVRPFILEELELDPKYETFSGVITEYEAEYGGIAGIYRDPRGTLYHPHTGDEIPLGTLNVEDYQRPEWTFNKILYLEKEGFFPILHAAGWPERHDCALLTAKGYATRAARDVLDLLGETDEDLWFYCIHDADAYGTMIYQALQEETLARGRRRVHIVNLGLEPEEAIAMGLQVENVNRKGVAPVADYVEEYWQDWLQEHRVELNAMTTPQFLEWLDRKFADQVGKLVPPVTVLTDRLESEVRQNLRERIAERLLAEAGIDTLVDEALAERAEPIKIAVATIAEDVAEALDASPQEPWTGAVQEIAAEIAGRDP